MGGSASSCDPEGPGEPAGAATVTPMRTEVGHGGVVPATSVWVVVSGLLLGQFLSAMDTLLVVTALPTIVGDLGGGDRVSWIITAYLLTSTALSPLVGKLGDLYGRRRLYQIAIATFMFGSVLAGVAGDMNQLIVARAVQGLGASGMMTLPMAIIGDVAAPRDRPRYQGVMGASMLVASIAGPLVGGFFVDNASWRGAFWINLPMGLLALLATRRLPAPRRTVAKVQLDIAGSFCVVAASACSLLVVEWGGRRYGWTSPQIVALLTGAVVFVTSLVVVERRAPEPVLPARIFRNKVVLVVIAGGVLTSVGMWVPWVLMPTWLQVVTGASATNSGLNLAPIIVSLTATSALVGRQITRTGRYHFYPPVGALVATGALYLYSTLDVSSTRVEAGIYMAILGVGLGMSMQVLVVIVQANADHRDIGVATAALGFTRQLGGALGATIAVSVYTSRLGENLAEAFSPAELEVIDAEALRGSPEAIRALDPAIAGPVVGAFSDALTQAFLYASPPMFLAGLVFLFVRHQDLPTELDLGNSADANTNAPPV
jgi:EmrB/QacA subfamily drug resistance transporter